MSKLALLFLGIFGVGIIGALFYDSSLSFLLYQLVYFLDPKERWWGHQLPDISYSFISSILMLLVLAFNYQKLSKFNPWKGHPALIWLAALLMCYYLAYFWAVDMYMQQRFTYDFMKLVVVVFAAYKLINTKKSLDWSLWAYIIGCTYIGYLATSTGRNAGDRVEGIALPSTGGDVNPVAAALVPAGVLLLYFAWMGNKKIKVLCIFCGALIANGLVLFNSRGAFLGASVSTSIYLLYMIFSRHRQPGQRGVAIFIIALGIGGFFYVADNLFWQRMSTIDNAHDKDSGRGRIQFWFAALKMMKDHPLGLGIYGFNVLSSHYLTDEQRGGVHYRAVHSLWFQGLTEVGWHGMIIFLSMLFTLYRLSRRARRAILAEKDYAAFFKLLALECGLIGYLVTSTFINQFRAEILYWFVLLVAAGTNIYYLRPELERQQEAKVSKRVLRNKVKT
ncbi:O-antigen ligase family protein [Mangrovitalea sediminis]|uniref:O-antigen ligase family protein n=1 Tax=Mangrovitalea sediminis TaxID=1982043 RepID=UPI000BE54C50|nr:O-antigen ligase family protein [Mangrovitalea sediminis]